MEASKVIFGRETRAALSSRPMSPKHRIKLRQERVKDYIRSKPVGATISITELGIAAGFPGNTSGGWQFIRSMVRSGEIVKEDRGGPRTVSWSIPNEPRTLKEADRDHIATVEPPQPVTPDPPPAGRVAPHHHQPRGNGQRLRLGNRRRQLAWIY